MRRLVSVLAVAAVAVVLLVAGFAAVAVPVARWQAAFDRAVERRVAELRAGRGESR